MHDPSRYDDKNGFFKEQPDKKSYELASQVPSEGLCSRGTGLVSDEGAMGAQDASTTSN